MAQSTMAGSNSYESRMQQPFTAVPTGLTEWYLTTILLAVIPAVFVVCRPSDLTLACMATLTVFGIRSFVLGRKVVLEIRYEGFRANTEAVLIRSKPANTIWIESKKGGAGVLLCAAAIVMEAILGGAEPNVRAIVAAKLSGIRTRLDDLKLRQRAATLIGFGYTAVGMLVLFGGLDFAGDQEAFADSAFAAVSGFKTALLTTVLGIFISMLLSGQASRGESGLENLKTQLEAHLSFLRRREDLA